MIDRPTRRKRATFAPQDTRRYNQKRLPSETIDIHYVAAALGVATLVTIIVWEKVRPHKLRSVPGPLAGVLVAAAGAAIVQATTNANIASVQVGDSIIGYLSLPSAASLSLLKSKAVWTSALRARVRGQRRDTLMRDRRISNAPREPHELRSGTRSAGNREYTLRHGGDASHHRRHQSKYGQRPSRRYHSMVVGDPRYLDSPFRCLSPSHPLLCAAIGARCDPDLCWFQTRQRKRCKRNGLVRQTSARYLRELPR